MPVIRNPVLLLAWGLPAVAVVASFLSLFLTLRSPESELPEQYHWEGFQLDRDFSQAARATALEVHAGLSGFGAGGRCEIALRIRGAAPAALDLLIAHATQPGLDQRVAFERTTDGARAGDSLEHYAGACRAAQEAHWRLELIDTKHGWAVRQTIRGQLDGAAIDAVSGVNE